MQTQSQTHTTIHQDKPNRRKDAIGWSTIRVRDETMSRLDKIRDLDQSFDSVIMGLIERNEELEQSS